MPIEGVSDFRHNFPRIGKIRLGIKKQSKTKEDTYYPSATDYFVCPEEVKAVYGDQPKELKIMFPADAIELVAPQYLKCYSYHQGLICKGTGKSCRRKIDMKTGDFANRETGPIRGKDWDYYEAPCDGPKCPMQPAKQCRQVMSLVFLLPDVPRLGVYQLDTSSFYSIANVNTMIGEIDPVDDNKTGYLRKFTREFTPGGRICFLPLILSVRPEEKNPPGEGRKTIHVLHIEAAVKLTDLIATSRKSAIKALLPTLSEEEPPEDLFPHELIGGPVVNEQEPQNEGSVIQNISSVIQKPKEPDSTTHVLQNKSSVIQKVEEVKPKVIPPCQCPKPVPANEVLMGTDLACYHTACKGYLCTPDIDCFPGCPHIPVNTEQKKSRLKPGWEEITKDQVPDYLSLEMVFLRLMPGRSTRDMYRALGINSRNEATITAWDAFLNLKELAKEPPE